MLHRLTHRNSVGIFLVQPFGIELANQRARAEEGRPVALAFFFCKADHFDVEGQAFALTLQFAHAGHGHKDAEPAVVFAAVAHGVVVGARQQGFCVGKLRLVAAHYIAHRVNAHLVKAAFTHAGADKCRAGAVRVGQVSYRELAFFQIAGVAVLGQLLMPVPDLIAQRGLYSELVVQANFHDAVDVAQAFLQLKIRMVLQPAREGGDDLLPAQAHAARAAHREDERKAEFCVVVGVELLQRGEFFGRAMGQTGLALLVGRFDAEACADHRLAGQFRVGLDELDLRFLASIVQHPRHDVFQLRQ